MMGDARLHPCGAAALVALLCSCDLLERVPSCCLRQRSPGPARFESGPHNIISRPGQSFSVQIDARADRPGKTLEGGYGVVEWLNAPLASGPADLPVVETPTAETYDTDGGPNAELILRGCGTVNTCEQRRFVVVTDPRVDGGPAYLRFNIDVDYTFGESDEEYEAAPATLNVTVTLPLEPVDAGP